MPIINCPYPDCTYATGDITEALAITMLTIHATGVHPANAATPNNQQAAPKPSPQKVKRPTITAAGTNEAWSYFLARWEEYVPATKVTGKEKVIQLLG